MTSLKYKTYLFFWKLNPFKKQTLDFVKKTKLGDNPKFMDDLYLNNKFKVEVDNISFYLYNKKYDKSSFDIYLKGIDSGWDRFSLKIWKSLAEKSTSIFDVGTNIGLYCLTAKVSNPKAKVYGFEPSKNSFQTVEKNINLNKLDIKLEKLALSNINGEATFYDMKTHTATSSLVLNSNLKNDNLISYQVKVTTFDDYITNNKIQQVDLVSIDVEENEENVLLGMTQVLDKYRPSILIEVLNHELGEKVQRILDAFNYTYYFINEDGNLKQTTSLSEKPADFLESNNVLAVYKKDINEYVQSNWI